MVEKASDGFSEQVVNRAIGAVCGGAAGDALGAGYEFTNPSPDQEIIMKGGGAFGWATGEWTDDTAMALAILDELALGRCDIESIGDNFLAWYVSAPPDVGIQTSSVLSSVQNGAELITAGHEFYVNNPDKSGNGGLMRTGPVALSGLGDREVVAENAAAIAALTHAHHDSTAACVLWSLAIEEAIMTASDETEFDWQTAVRSGLKYLDEETASRWDTIIDAAVQGPSGLFNPNGFALGAFTAALSAIIETPVPEENPKQHFVNALETAVRIGDDCDTVAAIAGSLLGARWGVDAIPEEWQDLIHGSRTNDGETVTLSSIKNLVSRSLAS